MMIMIMMMLLTIWVQQLQPVMNPVARSHSINLLESQQQQQNHQKKRDQRCVLKEKPSSLPDLSQWRLWRLSVQFQWADRCDHTKQWQNGKSWISWDWVEAVFQSGPFLGLEQSWMNKKREREIYVMKKKKKLFVHLNGTITVTSFHVWSLIPWRT